MYDGTIVGDEKTPLGQMARHARRIFFRKPRVTDEDIAAGVSALMKDIPDKAVAAKPKRGRPPKVKKRVRRRKTYRSSR
jgi:hypothetical protein